MDGVSMVGFTHRGATMPLLEQVSVPRGERGRLLSALRDAGYPEAVVLSTCSRTEIYAGPTGNGPQGLLTVLGAHVGRSSIEMRLAAEIREGHDVVEHLFQVTAGLLSRVIGEVEILGQVRGAFREAQAAGMVGPSLGQLFPAAVRCGWRVREQTTLGDHARSLGQRAVDLGLAALGDAPDAVIIVVGSGRMASTVVQHLTLLGRRPRVAARNEVQAARLAGPDLVCSMPALATGIEQADLLICATSAPHHVVTLDHVRDAMAARERPLTVVDLSVPRNVDTAVASVPDVALIDLTGMNDDATTDVALSAALEAGAAIVRTAARRYAADIAARRAGPVIAAIRQRVEQTCLRELAGQAASGAIDADDLARAASAVAGKLLHRPTIAARAAAIAGDTDALLALCATFGVTLPDLWLSGPAIARSQVAG